MYESINRVSISKELIRKSMFGFVGAPWTLLVYMLNKKSPKNDIDKNLFKDKKKIEDLLEIINTYLKLHIKNQINAGATIIQIFDSWAGLIENESINFCIVLIFW